MKFEFGELLLQYAHSHSPDEKQAIEEKLWSQFGVEEAVFVLDMSGFSRLTQKFGVIHYLSMVRRMQLRVEPIVTNHGGRIVKFEADNCFARFPRTVDAIHAAIAVNEAFAEDNIHVSEDLDIRVSCGIDYGRFLLIRGTDYFGDPVNRACKLGEDVGEPGEILVTQEGILSIPTPCPFATEAVHVAIAGIILDAHRIVHSEGQHKTSG